jgi:hypothetical protein
MKTLKVFIVLMTALVMVLSSEIAFGYEQGGWPDNFGPYPYYTPFSDPYYHPPVVTASSAFTTYVELSQVQAVPKLVPPSDPIPNPVPPTDPIPEPIIIS